MTKYYDDTCIWRDYYENRSDKLKPLGEFALLFFNNVIKNKDIILISDVIIDELSINYSLEQINLIFKVIKENNLLIKINLDKKIMNDAYLLHADLKLGKGDAINSAIAKKYSAILVTRDFHYLITDIVIRKPEDLI